MRAHTAYGKKQRARMTVTADRGGYRGFVGIEERGNAGPMGDEHLLERGGPEGWATPRKHIGSTLLRDPVFVEKLIVRWRQQREERGLGGDLLRAIDATPASCTGPRSATPGCGARRATLTTRPRRDLKAWLVARVPLDRREHRRPARRRAALAMSAPGPAGMMVRGTEAWTS